MSFDLFYLWPQWLWWVSCWKVSLNSSADCNGFSLALSSSSFKCVQGVEQHLTYLTEALTGFAVLWHQLFHQGQISGKHIRCRQIFAPDLVVFCSSCWIIMGSLLIRQVMSFLQPVRLMHFQVLVSFLFCHINAIFLVCGDWFTFKPGICKG